MFLSVGILVSAPVFAGERGGPPVIVTLAKRDKIITIKAGPVYFIRTTSGEILADNLTAEQLQAGNPELFRDVKSVVAAQEGAIGDNTYLDASEGPPGLGRP
jgi:hypothetical protein